MSDFTVLNRDLIAWFSDVPPEKQAIIINVL